MGRRPTPQNSERTTRATTEAKGDPWNGRPAVAPEVSDWNAKILEAATPAEDPGISQRSSARRARARLLRKGPEWPQGSCPSRLGQRVAHKRPARELATPVRLVDPRI